MSVPGRTSPGLDSQLAIPTTDIQVFRKVSGSELPPQCVQEHSVYSVRMNLIVLRDVTFLFVGCFAVLMSISHKARGGDSPFLDQDLGGCSKICLGLKLEEILLTDPSS